MENKKMETKKKEKVLIFFILLITLSFIFGFFLNENSAGGGEGDFINHTWKNLQLFNSNSLFEALKLTNTVDFDIFQSSRIPGFYVFNKVFNPFINNIEYYRASIFTLSLIVPMILYKCLVVKYKNINKLYLAFLSSLILLSPYFRTSAIWGNEENFAYIASIISFFFLLKYQNSEEKFKIFFLIMLIISSSTCVYFDQKFTIIPALCFFIIFFNTSNLKKKLLIFTLYFFMSLPVLYLFYIWGGLLPPMDQLGRDVHLGKFNFQNFGYALTIILFYIFPFIICSFDIKKVKQLIIFRDNSERVIFCFVLMYLVYFIFFYDISNEVMLGKGVFYKLSILITKNIFYQKIILAIFILLAFKAIMLLFEKNFLNFFALCFIAFTPILYKPILQEYFDPMVIILIFTFLNIKFLITYRNLIVLFVYFSSFLIFANFYYVNILS